MVNQQKALSKVFGDPQKKTLKRLQKRVAQVNALADKYAKMSKKELKEQVMLRLRMRFLPIPAEFQVVWNTTDSMLYFASTQQKMLDMFQELFTRTFELHIEPYTPYEAAAQIIGDAAPLDRLEPTNFA